MQAFGECESQTRPTRHRIGKRFGVFERLRSTTARRDNPQGAAHFKPDATTRPPGLRWLMMLAMASGRCATGVTADSTTSRADG